MRITMAETNGTKKAGGSKKVLKIAAGVILLIVLVNAFGGNGKDSDSQSNSTGSTASQTTEGQPVKATGIGVGEVLSANYFDVTVNEVSLSSRVNTGNMFSDLDPEPGSQYLILNVSFKNTSDESRMLTNGTVWIEYNGKKYEFDHAETILLEGWGTMDQINPLMTKITNVVYKIPDEINGPAYYQPGRASKNQRIFLGDVQ